MAGVNRQRSAYKVIMKQPQITCLILLLKIIQVTDQVLHSWNSDDLNPVDATNELLEEIKIDDLTGTNSVSI